MKIIKEAHYGGAFDIEDDQFFTRDDLDEFGYYVEEELNNSDCSCPKEFQYAGCWIDNNVVTCAMNNGDYEHEIDFRVDMRRIRSPRDLIKRYAPNAIEEFKEAFETYYSYEMFIEFEAGAGRHFDEVNYLIGENNDTKVYAEVEVPEGASEDYGYLTMKKALIAAMPSLNYANWRYDGQEEYLNRDADADCEVYLDIDTADSSVNYH